MRASHFITKITAIITIFALLSSPLAPITSVKPAYAAVPTFEVNTLLTSIFPRDLYEFASRILTEIVKGNILNLINQIIDQYIKGSASDCPPYLRPLLGIAGGQNLCPKFVTNWEKFLFSAERRADLRLREEIRRANISEANRQALLRLIPSVSEFGQTFDEVFQYNEICDPDTIEDPFEQIQCATDPANSIELQYAIFAERRKESKQIAREADAAKGIANQNYLGTEQCPGRWVTDDETGQTVCLEGVITKPGIIDKEIQAEAKTSDIKRVVNAFNLESMLAGLINMFINQLISQGLDGLLGLIGRGPIILGETPLPPVPTPPPPMTGLITMTATPQIIEPGQSSVISWSAPAGATACVASGAWSGTRPTSGSEVVRPPTTSTYTLTCTDTYGSQISQSVTITVTSPGGGGGGGDL